MPGILLRVFYVVPASVGPVVIITVLSLSLGDPSLHASHFIPNVVNHTVGFMRRTETGRAPCAPQGPYGQDLYPGPPHTGIAYSVRHHVDSFEIESQKS